MRIEDKDPTAVKDLSWDWEEWLDGDTIVASTWAVEPAGELTVLGSDFTSTTSTVWLTGGTLLSSYRVTNTITTAAGRIEPLTMTINLVKT